MPPYGCLTYLCTHDPVDSLNPSNGRLTACTFFAGAGNTIADAILRRIAGTVQQEEALTAVSVNPNTYFSRPEQAIKALAPVRPAQRFSALCSKLKRFKQVAYLRCV
eukprot:1147280-Pelagomonas_calceolata.AAC.19